ncbi:SpoIIE family protein phosphatase [Streptomyces sp. WMMC905]|uniref:SpoIIE family protein phosphatase n=1 Tax=Streptomyces sp. WMMC905 TaxID=3404123 RepID=UPI003B925922
MGAIPTQRETTARAGGSSPHGAETTAQIRATLPGSSLAPGAARALLRLALADWAGPRPPGAERFVEDALLVVSELVTNAVVHTGTDIEVAFRLEEDGALVVEACDRGPCAPPARGASPGLFDAPEHGRGLGLVAGLADSWGITHRGGAKTVWARLPPPGTPPLAGPGGSGEEGAHHGLGMAPPPVGGPPPEAYARPLGWPDPEPVGGRDHPEEPGRTAAAPPHGDPGSPASRGRGPDSLAHARHDPDRSHSLPASWGRDDAPVPWAPPAETVVREGHPARSAGPRREVDATWGSSVASTRLDRRDREWLGRGALSFLAEASDLLAGQLDEDRVVSLTGRLIVPRIADWCAVWLEDDSPGSPAAGTRLARVWHDSESRAEELRRVLERESPRPPDLAHVGPDNHPWPGEAFGPGASRGAALAFRLAAGGRPVGTLVIGREGPTSFPDEITGLVEDLARRVALAVGTARRYARQATISAVLQRGLLPGAVAEIPGVRTALVHEPFDKGGPSGDFYDLFPAGDGRWCFAVGDVQGKGPEAAVVIGLVRPWLRLLAREGYGVPGVLDRLNQLLLDDATEAADAAARALVAAGARPFAPGDGPQTRFLSLLYGELSPVEGGGLRCTLAAAGHPLPLLLAPDGAVRVVARPQTLLGVVEDVAYVSDTLELASGDTLLCVTDGVTERRDGHRQLDDGDGLAAAFAACAGLDAERIAESLRSLVHDFGDHPPADDVAMLVLQTE